MLRRALQIILAGVLACFGAAAVITVAALLPEWSALVLDALEGGFAAHLITFVALFFSLAGLLPALIVIILAEAMSIRSVLFYAFAGAAVTCLLYLSATEWSTLALSVDGFARREIEIMAAAGIIAGFIYWAVAGRSAGAWRQPMEGRAT